MNSICNEEGMDSHDWEFSVSIGYSIPGNDKAGTNQVEWKLSNQSHPVVQVLLQDSVRLLNEGGFELYIKMLEQCGESRLADDVKAVFRNKS